MAIDLDERQDLKLELARGALTSAYCPLCATKAERTSPLLLIRLAKRIPVALAGPHDVKGEDLVALGAQVIARALAALGPLAHELPGPVLTLPFETAEFAAGRPVDKDLELPLAESGSTTFANYLTFLELVRDSEPQRRVEYGLTRLRFIDSADELRRLAIEVPEIISQLSFEVINEALEVEEDDTERFVLQGMKGLLEVLKEKGPDPAWSLRSEQVNKFWTTHVGPFFEELCNSLSTAIEQEDHATVVKSGYELLPLVKGFNDETEAWVCCSLADSLCQPGSGYSQRLEEAIRFYDRSREIIQSNPSLDIDGRHASVLNNLGAAYGRRVEGDIESNLERSIEYLRAALARTSIDIDGRSWAMAHTNLALALTERRLGDSDSNAAEAQEHLLESLRWRTFERDPLDWAYTHINLGLLYAQQPGRANRQKAIAHGLEARRGAIASGDSTLLIHTESNLSAEKQALANLDDTTSADSQRLIQEAEDHARAGLNVPNLELSPLEAGRTWLQLGDVLAMDTLRRSETEAAFASSLSYLTTSSAPTASRRAATSLASLREQLGDIEGAADAWEVAVETAEVALLSRPTRRGRLEELRETVTLFRFASYALAKSGRVERAIEVLERGRAREMGSLLHHEAFDLERLRFLDADLHTDFLEIRHSLDSLESSGIGVEPDRKAAGERFQEALQRIRELPGMESAFQASTIADIGRAAVSGQPLAYILSAPLGSGLLIVNKDSPGSAVSTSFIDVPDLPSSAIANQLLGIIESGDPTAEAFLWAQESAGDLNESLRSLEPTLGIRLMKPLHHALESMRARGVTLVATGLFGLIPLHALRWSDDDFSARCLLDQFEILFAPSAFVHEGCKVRAAKRGNSATRLLALGNPLPHGSPLPDAQYEAETIAATVKVRDTVLLTGDQATKGRLLENIGTSSHIHLACHGSSSFTGDSFTAFLSLSSEELLTAREVMAARTTARLVVLSACETGVIQDYETADEVFSLESAFLAAGAATVVSALWAVPDLSTSILMCRFYEMIADGKEPVASLRQAQLWLRNLTGQEANRFIAKRALLRKQQRVTVRGVYSPMESPFGDYQHWAGFRVCGA